MNIFTKTLLVSAMALAATGAAEARIQAIGDATADGSELLLNVWNSTAQNSYTLDLGITIAQFLANPSQTLSININNSDFASFQNAFTVGNAVTWGVFGGHGVLAVEADQPIYGFYTTATSAPASFDTNSADISNTMGKWNGLVGDIQTLGVNSNNHSTFRTVGNGGYTGEFGNDFQTALPFTAQGNLSDSLIFVHEMVSASDFDTGELVTFANSWNINLASGTLTYAPSAVPVPAAVWMFGAGLMGVLRLNRRKSMAA